MDNQPPELFKRDRQDLNVITYVSLSIAGVAVLGAAFPIVGTIVGIIGGLLVLLVICIGIGKYLKYRRLEHEAYYGDPSTFPEVKERNDGQV